MSLNTRKIARQRKLSQMGSSMVDLGVANNVHDTVINNLLYTEEKIDIETFRKYAKEHLFPEWRFCSSLTIGKNGEPSHWNINDEDPDINFHVRDVAIPTKNTDGIASQQEIVDYVAETYGEPFDFTRPLWSMESITNVRNCGPDANSHGVILFRIHHAIGDGMSLLNVMQSSWETDTIKDTPSSSSLRSKIKKVSTFYDKIHLAANFFYGIYSGALMPVLPGDLKTSLQIGNCSKIGKRNLAISESIDLESIKAIKEKVGCTVNDVLIAALAGSIKKYLQKRDENNEGLIRVLCAIDMRPATEALSLNNQFSFLSLPLPVSENDPLDRIFTCAQTCSDAKTSPAPVVTYKINQFASKILPKGAYLQATHDTFNKCTAVFSNVIGPPRQIKLAGHKLTNMTFFANSLTSIVFGLVSYNNKISMSIVADESVSEPRELLDFFVKELEDQKKAIANQETITKPLPTSKAIITDYAIIGIALAIFVLFLLFLQKIIFFFL